MESSDSTYTVPSNDYDETSSYSTNISENTKLSQGQRKMLMFALGDNRCNNEYQHETITPMSYSIDSRDHSLQSSDDEDDNDQSLRYISKDENTDSDSEISVIVENLRSTQHKDHFDCSDNSDSDNSDSDNSGSDNSGSDNSGSDNSGSNNSGSDNSGKSDDNKEYETSNSRGYKKYCKRRKQRSNNFKYLIVFLIFVVLLVLIIFHSSIDKYMSKYIKDENYRLYTKGLLFLLLLFVIGIVSFSGNNYSHKN